MHLVRRAVGAGLARRERDEDGVGVEFVGDGGVGGGEVEGEGCAVGVFLWQGGGAGEGDGLEGVGGCGASWGGGDDPVCGGLDGGYVGVEVFAGLDFKGGVVVIFVVVVVGVVVVGWGDEAGLDADESGLGGGRGGGVEVDSWAGADSAAERGHAGEAAEDAAEDRSCPPVGTVG